eukprot:2262245-Rhodomonas_salina.1
MVSAERGWRSVRGACTSMWCAPAEEDEGASKGRASRAQGAGRREQRAENRDQRAGRRWREKDDQAAVVVCCDVTEGAVTDCDVTEGGQRDTRGRVLWLTLSSLPTHSPFSPHPLSPSLPSHPPLYLPCPAPGLSLPQPHLASRAPSFRPRAGRKPRESTSSTTARTTRSCSTAATPTSSGLRSTPLAGPASGPGCCCQSGGLGQGDRVAVLGSARTGCVGFCFSFEGEVLTRAWGQVQGVPSLARRQRHGRRHCEGGAGPVLPRILFFCLVTLHPASFALASCCRV